MKNVQDVQKMFSIYDLYHKGDLETGSILVVDEKGAKVLTYGGCQGYIKGELPEILHQGSNVEVEFEEIENYMPVFKLTKRFILEKLPQNCVVYMATPRLIVVEFAGFEDTYGVYKPLPEDNLRLKRGDRVIVSQLQFDGSNYLIGKLELAPVVAETPESPQEVIVSKTNNPLAPWDAKKIKAVRDLGSRAVSGKYRLGRVYPVVPYIKGSKEVLFESDKDNKTGEMNIRFPERLQRAFARVVFITENSKISLEFVKGEDEPKRSDNEKRNDEVFNAGRANGSEVRAGGYWLGYSYTVSVRNSLPYFKPNMNDPRNLMESAEIRLNPGYPEFQDEDRLLAEITHIERIGNTNKYIFTINVLKRTLF